MKGGTVSPTNSTWITRGQSLNIRERAQDTRDTGGKEANSLFLVRCEGKVGKALSV